MWGGGLGPAGSSFHSPPSHWQSLAFNGLSSSCGVTRLVTSPALISGLLRPSRDPSPACGPTSPGRRDGPSSASCPSVAWAPSSPVQASASLCRSPAPLCAAPRPEVALCAPRGSRRGRLRLPGSSQAALFFSSFPALEFLAQTAARPSTRARGLGGAGAQGGDEARGSPFLRSGLPRLPECGWRFLGQTPQASDSGRGSVAAAR